MLLYIILEYINNSSHIIFIILLFYYCTITITINIIILWIATNLRFLQWQFFLCHCEEWNDEAIHKLQKVNTKTKRKRIPWINNCIPYRDCHEPSVLAMTVWVVCGCLYNEILTPSAKSRNDSFIIAMTMWGVLSLISFVIARSETTKQSINNYSFIY